MVAQEYIIWSDFKKFELIHLRPILLPTKISKSWQNVNIVRRYHISTKTLRLRGQDAIEQRTIWAST
jgi:hypothetical protein